MFTKVSVLIPTRHRIGRLMRLLDSYAVTRGDDSELVFRVDDDDEDTQVFLAGRPFTRAVVGPRLHGYGSMAAFFNEAANGATGDVLMCGNDDMAFRTPGWAARILSAANCYPDGLFDLGVSTHNETHYPFSIVSRMAVECLGFIWDPRVFWGDIFLRDVMAALGRTRFLPDVRIDHDWAGADPDEVYREGLPYKATVETDPAYWTRVHEPAVHEAAMRLGSLTWSTSVSRC